MRLPVRYFASLGESSLMLQHHACMCGEGSNLGIPRPQVGHILHCWTEIMRSIVVIVCTLSLLVQSAAFVFRATPWLLSQGTRRDRASYEETSFLVHANTGDDDFDGADFNEALKAAGPIPNNAFSNPDPELLDGIRAEQVCLQNSLSLWSTSIHFTSVELTPIQAARDEAIYREYPFANTSLPILPDCNNYYSGKFENYFWHQNAGIASSVNFSSTPMCHFSLTLSFFIL